MKLKFEKLEDRCTPNATLSSLFNYKDVDLNLDGTMDQVGFALKGGGPVLIVNNEAFFTFEPSFRGGINCIVEDVDGDILPEIIVCPGPGGGPVVKIYDGITLKEKNSFFAFEENMRTGMIVSAIDYDLDGVREIFTGPLKGGSRRVTAHDSDGNRMFDQLFSDPDNRDGFELFPLINQVNQSNITIFGNVSDEEIISVAKSFVKIPNKILNNTSIFISEGEVTNNPILDSIKDYQPETYPEGFTLSQVTGLYNVDTNQIFLPSNKLDEHITLHEFGHSADRGKSDSSEWIDLLNRYPQINFINPEESFAETFSNYFSNPTVNDLPKEVNDYMRLLI